MARCAGYKPDGIPCERIVKASQTYCFSHDPERAGERKRNASKAGKGGGSMEIRDLKKQLEDLAAGVLDGTVDRGNAAVINQIINTRARLIELERKVREVEELEARIAELEERTQGGRAWRA